MNILAIDPGPSQSAFVLWTGRVSEQGHVDNGELLRRIIAREFGGPDVLTVIEQIAAMGMAVGASVFETVFWSGRFAQAAGRFERLPRVKVKHYLCGTHRAKDANVRQALIDKFGGPAAIGRKAAKGPLYGISSHRWAALALAITWSEQHQEVR